MLCLQVSALQNVSEDADPQHDAHEDNEPRPDRRLRKCVHRAHQACASQQRAQHGEQERGEDQPHIPALHHAFALLHHHGVQKCGSRQPRHEARVLHRVPAPVAAPAQHGIGPVHAEKNAAGQKQPRHHRPDARDPDPLLAGVAHHQRAQRKRKRHREANIPEIKHRRMNHHLRVLQQGIEPVAIGRNGSHSGDVTRKQRERRRGKNQHRQKEHLDARQNRSRVGVKLHIRLVRQPQNEAISSQQPRPQQQRAFLAAPERREFVRNRQRAVGVFKDVGNGEIVGKD